MTQVGITKPGAAPKLYTAPADPKGQPVFLDSGGTLSRLPTPLFNEILADFPGATLDPSGSVYIVDCAISGQAGSVDFVFGKTTIRVPFHDFIWEADTDVCVLGVVAEDEAPVLGDTFLRAAFGKLTIFFWNSVLIQSQWCMIKTTRISSWRKLLTAAPTLLKLPKVLMPSHHLLVTAANLLHRLRLLRPLPRHLRSPPRLPQSRNQARSQVRRQLQLEARPLAARAAKSTLTPRPLQAARSPLCTPLPPTLSHPVLQLSPIVPMAT